MSASLVLVVGYKVLQVRGKMYMLNGLCVITVTGVLSSLTLTNSLYI